MRYILLLLLTISLPSFGGGESKQVKSEASFAEKARVQSIKKTIRDGQLVWLESGSKKFFAIYKQGDNPSTKQGVVIVPDRDHNPNWPRLIKPLRTHLPNYGLSTIAIEIPEIAPESPLIAKKGSSGTDDDATKKAVSEAESKHSSRATPNSLNNEVTMRIKAATDYLKKQRAEQIVLLGHGLGADFVLHSAMSDKLDRARLLGIVLMSAHGLAALLPVSSKLKTGLPVLELVGELDSDLIKQDAKMRKKLTRKAEKSNYRLIEIPGADHEYQPTEDIMMNRLRGWLMHLTESMPAKSGERKDS